MDAKIEALVEAWAEGHWEFTLAFEGLNDEDLWMRPSPNLHSIGELAGHVAYWEAILLPEGTIDSPLKDERFADYSGQVENEVKLDLTVAQVLEEVKRIYEATKAYAEEVAVMDEPVPARPDWTWGAILRYRVFHTAYHCGQAYSVRHLMGHETTDN